MPDPASIARALEQLPTASADQLRRALWAALHGMADVSHAQEQDKACDQILAAILAAILEPTA